MLPRSILLTAFASLVTAQLDPNTVPLATRMAWCQSQTTACPLLCLDQSGSSVSANSCDAKTLNFYCVCSTGASPNISEYSQTIPYFICTEVGNQCVANCGNGANLCAENCRTSRPCGALNPTRVNVTSTSSASSSAATATDVAFNGFGGDSGSSSSGNTKKNSASTLLLSVGQSTGLSVVVAGTVLGLVLGLN